MEKSLIMNTKALSKEQWTKWKEQLGLEAKQIQPGFHLSSDVLEKMAVYTELLLHWNRAYNLTAIDTYEGIRKLHILDSLTIAPYIIGRYILDVGSGAGFPGIPLALTLPQYKFVLLDSNNKKVNFLRHVVRNLSLSNVEVFQERAETFNYYENNNIDKNICFNTIVTRATGSILEIVAATKHLCCANGQWLFMKGKNPESEIQEMTSCKFAVTITTQCLKIPGEEVSRNLVCIKNQIQK